MIRAHDKILRARGRAALLRRPRIGSERQLCPTRQAKISVLHPSDHSCAFLLVSAGRQSYVESVRWPKRRSKLPLTAMSLRLERVRELLKREIGEVIRRELPVNEAGLINVNDLQVAPNLKNATVFIGILGGPAQKEKGMQLLEKHRKRIQGLVARGVVLKYTPRLRFVLDESVERGNRILKILEELETTTPSS